MLANLALTINIVLPLFLVMIVGFCARRGKLLDENSVGVINKLVFRIFLPVLLCTNIMSVDDSQAIGGKTLLYALVCILLLFFVLLWLIPRLEKTENRRGVLIQAIMRSNYALFGIPLAQAMYPGQTVGIASLLVMVAIPVFNILSVVALEMHRGGKCNARTILKGIAKNPLIWACIVGFFLWKAPFQLPTFILSAMKQLASIASPLALFVLGAALHPESIRGSRRALGIGLVGRLFVVPMIFLPIAVLLGFRDADLASLMCLFAAPAAVSSYTMAVLMGGDGELAGSLVVLTTTCSAITIFLFIFIGKSLCLF